MLVLVLEQSDSVVYIFQIKFHYRLLQNIEYNSQYYTINPCCLSVLPIVVCICPGEGNGNPLTPVFLPIEYQARWANTQCRQMRQSSILGQSKCSMSVDVAVNNSGMSIILIEL